MQNMMETACQGNANPVIPSESEALRLTIKRKLRKWKREREKRKSSKVVKGLEMPSGREFVEVFENV